MRKWAAFFSGILVFLPAVSLAATVTYSSSLDKVCPANSTASGSGCACNSGYVVSGGACVKDSAPVNANEIYEDIRSQIAFNSDLTCAQLGIVVSPDLDMCTKFKATPDLDKANWKSIPRPSTAVTMITNPWAPPSQQVLYGTEATSTPTPTPTSTAKVTAPAPTPPPPPVPVPTPTPIVQPAPEPDPEPVAKKMPAMKSADEMETKKDSAPKKEKVVQATEPGDESLKPVLPGIDPLSQIGSAAAPETGLVVASTTQGLAPLTLSESEKIPVKKPVEPEPPKHQSLFARFTSWLFSFFYPQFKNGPPLGRAVLFLLGGIINRVAPLWRRRACSAPCRQ